MNDEIKNLEKQLGEVEDVHERVDLLNTLAMELRESDPKRGLEHGAEALELARAEDYRNGIAQSLLRLSQLNSHLGHNGAALGQASESLAMCEDLGDEVSEMRAAALMTLSVIHGNLGSDSDALETGLLALRLCRDHGHRGLEGTILSNLGATYNSMGDYTQELEVYEQALRIYKEFGNERQSAIIFNNMAMAYRSLADWPNAVEKAQQCLRAVGGDERNVMLETVVLCTLGEIYLEMNEHDESLDYLQRSMDLARKIGFRPLVMCALLGIGKIELARGRPEEAISCLKEALVIGTECGCTTETIECRQVLTNAYKQQGNLIAAMECFEQLYAAQRNLSKEEMAKKIANLRVLHETEAAVKEAEIYRLRNIELEARNAELDAFAHTVAHDIRGPLSGILGASEILLGCDGISTDRRRRFLHSIGDGAQCISRIIDALLLLANVRGAARVEMRTLDMRRIVDAVRDRLAFLVDEHEARITCPEQFPAAIGYAPWVEEVWANYLSNAITYGGTPPVIEFGAVHQDNGFVRFRIRDNGPGLSPEAQERLFTPFERLHSVIPGSHGLGLSIVLRIIEKLGGQVGVESKLGHGSTFYLNPAIAPDMAGSLHFAQQSIYFARLRRGEVEPAGW